MWVQYLELSTDRSYLTIPSLLKCQVAEKWHQQQVAWLVTGRCHLMLFPLLTKNNITNILLKIKILLSTLQNLKTKKSRGRSFLIWLKSAIEIHKQVILLPVTDTGTLWVDGNVYKQTNTFTAITDYIQTVGSK